jgi:hypothetical protein
MSCQTPLRPLQSGAVNVAQVGLIAILIGVAIAGGLLLTNSLPPDDLAPAPAPASQPEASPPAEVETLAEPEQTPAPETRPEPAPEPARPPLPSLQESDSTVRDALADVPLGTAGQQFLLPSNIIERTTSVVYLLAEGEVPYKLLPIARPKAAYPVSDDGLQVTAAPEGHARYGALAAWIQSLDIGSLLAAVDWLLPLFREAWSFYGESESSFDQAVLSALDLIIYTPEVETSDARLFRKEAVWLYEDPTLEALPPIQKQLLRMGPANAATIKAKAREAQSLWSTHIALDD